MCIDKCRVNCIDCANWLRPFLFLLIFVHSIGDWIVFWIHVLHFGNLCFVAGFLGTHPRQPGSQHTVAATVCWDPGWRGCGDRADFNLIGSLGWHVQRRMSNKELGKIECEWKKSLYTFLLQYPGKLLKFDLIVTHCMSLADHTGYYPIPVITDQHKTMYFLYYNALLTTFSTELVC